MKVTLVLLTEFLIYVHSVIVLGILFMSTG